MKPIDLMMMIVMYSSCQSDKNKDAVVKAFRSLILSGDLNSSLLRDSLTLYVPVIKDEAFFMPLMKILSHFIRSTERAVANFTVELTSQLMQYLQNRQVHSFFTLFNIRRLSSKLPVR